VPDLGGTGSWESITGSVDAGRRFVILDISNYTGAKIARGPMTPASAENFYVVGIVLPQGGTLKAIEPHSFMNFHNVTAIDIPESITTIGACFSGSENLMEINAPGVTKWPSVSTFGTIADTPIEGFHRDVRREGHGTIGARINLAPHIEDLASLPTLLQDAYKKGGGGWDVCGEQGWVKAASKAAAQAVAAAGPVASAPARVRDGDASKAAPASAVVTVTDADG
jgi:hypothetical protein